MPRFCCLFAFLLLAACETPDAPSQTLPPDTTAATPDTLFDAYDRPFLQPTTLSMEEAEAWADSMLATLSLEEKVGQLVMVDLPDPDGANVSSAMEEAIEDYHVGGFLLPRLLEPADVARLTPELQAMAEVPLFIAADYERGVGRFLNNMTELPSNMALGATREPQWAAASGRLTALEARAIGVNLLFAPVVDVNNNPLNPIINIRAYGGEPELVGRMGAAYVEAAQQHGALTTLKHFPGHGNTTTDTHAELGVVAGTREELRDVELRPYTMIFDGPAQPAAVMTTHLWIEALDEEPTPATFSEAALTELLRGEMGFDGVVVTDDVKMGALQNDYDLFERVVRPLEAGADVALTPESLPHAVAALQEAVETGRLSEERLNTSVRRVLTAKARAGLHLAPAPPERAFAYLSEAPRGQPIADAIAREAVTVLRTAPVLPLADTTRVATVHLSNYRGSQSIAAAMERLDEQLGAQETFSFDGEPTTVEAQRIVETAREVDVVVLAVYIRLVAGRAEAVLFDAQQHLAERLVEASQEGGTPVILVTFGNPYAINAFPEAGAHVVTYDQTIATVDATAAVLQGTLAPQGRLPITLEQYAYGAGLTEL